jgi:hypothetical protein
MARKYKVQIRRAVQKDKERCRVTLDITGEATCKAKTLGDCLFLSYQALREEFKDWDKKRELRNAKQRERRSKLNSR